MADKTTEATKTDIFQQQSKTIELQQKLLSSQLSQPSQVIYATPAAPQGKPSPNYSMWLVGAVGFYFFFLRGKKL